MDYTPETLGWKLYGLHEFKKAGLFRRNLVIISDTDTEEKIIEQLKSSGFKDNDETAIRFSAQQSMNLPFHLGPFTLKEIAKTIRKEKEIDPNLISFVHGLVRTEFSMSLYYDGDIILAELWPGIGASKKNVFNENPDIIKITKENTVIQKYSRKRNVENIKFETIKAEPYDDIFLMKIAKRLASLKDALSKLLEIRTPLLCDLNCESIDDINFMGMQKTDRIDTDKNDVIHDFQLIKTIEDLHNSNTKKKIFFDIPIKRVNEDYGHIIKLLKKHRTVYLKSLTMHLAIILRENGIDVKKGILRNDYQKIESPDVKL